MRSDMCSFLSSVTYSLVSLSSGTRWCNSLLLFKIIWHGTHHDLAPNGSQLKLSYLEEAGFCASVCWKNNICQFTTVKVKVKRKSNKACYWSSRLIMTCRSQRLHKGSQLKHLQHLASFGVTEKSLSRWGCYYKYIEVTCIDLPKKNKQGCQGICFQLQ